MLTWNDDIERIFCPAERLSASQGGLCSTELIHKKPTYTQFIYSLLSCNASCLAAVNPLYNLHLKRNTFFSGTN
jgi:hypothetical protein